MLTGAVAPVSLYLLGSFEIRSGTQNSSAMLERKTRALLAYLAATDQPHSRQALSHWFCQEADDPVGNLHWHLSRIRRQLHP